MRISDVKQQTVVLKLQAKSKEAFFSMQDPTVSHLYDEHVIPVDFSCHLTEICDKQATIKEPDKFLS